MKSQQQQQQKGIILFPKWHVINTFSYFFIFACGVAAGVILNSYIKNLSFDLNLTNFSAISPPPPPLPTHEQEANTTSLCQPPPVVAAATTNNDAPPPPEMGRVGLREYMKIPEAMHDMEEEELLWRASMVAKVKEYPFERRPKVAFLFLTKGPILLTPMWEMFFKGVHPSLYSIYVHFSPSYVAPPHESPLFRSRRIPSQAVVWGKFNMMEAERRLLANALLDISNQRFVLLSESCIPLFNFSTVYSYLINSHHVHVEAYDSPAARSRYTQDMLPEMKISQWRKGSQWFEIDRDIALEVVSDRKYFTKLKNHCKNTACYVDEHYLPTYLSIEHWKKNSNRSVTWADWSNGGIHPNRYVRGEVTEGFLEKLRSGSGECLYNGETTTTCYLFARKFLTTSLVRLLRYAPKVMHFNP
ncbi:Glycosyltransferase BC10 [Linum grandiflorum]